MKKKLIDKVLLVVISFSGIAFVFFMNLFLRKIVSEEWTIFIVVSVVYVVMLFYLTFTFEDFKRVAKKKLFLYQVVFYILTVGIAYLIFRYKVLLMPKSHHLYIIGIVILAISSVVLLNYLVKRIEFFRNDKKETDR